MLYNRSDKGKGKGISFFSIHNPSIKPEKKDLAARWLFKIDTGGTVKYYTCSLAQRVCHEHFEGSSFEAELETRLGFRSKRPKHGAVPTYLIFIPHRAMFNKREKKAPRSAQKRRQDQLLHQVVGRQFLFRGYN